FRTDHHWSALGAYYAAEEFAKVAGVPFADLSTYTKNVRPGYVGTMYAYTDKSPILLNNPEDFITYEADKSTYTAKYYNHSFENGIERGLFWTFADKYRSQWYLTFLNGDAYSVHIKSNVCNNGRKVLLIKDSYGNAIPPYLLSSFEDIYVVDVRKYEKNIITFIKDQGVTDVLFAMSAFTVTGQINKYIDVIRTK
ncbi:hypothetical protein LJB90_03780, partial [Eubacteriales bacterium OttesenSCG-928-G02]|nr:hypothetical protein [Eubacteriales bacterium OttesenSCG-928-G02]